MRRQRRILIYVSAAAALAIAALGLQAVWLEPASLRIVEERIEVPLVQPGTLRIAILSDLHVGSPFNGIDHLREVVALTNASNPDIVGILGDLVIQGVVGGRFVTPEATAAELKLLRPAIGVFGVLDNHDSWLDHDRVARAVEQHGVRLVEDASTRVETRVGPIWIAGVSDLWTEKHDLAAALAGVPNDGVPVLLMTHNPDVSQVPGRVALTIAGHTHGGQVRLPFVGAPVIPSQFGQRFAAGHVVEGGRQLFVATGVGTSVLPVRFRVPPAVTVLTLNGPSQ